MWSKKSFEAKSYQEKIKCLHEIIDPLKDQKASFKRAHDILLKPDVSEDRLVKMYNHIFDIVEDQKTKKKELKLENGQKKIESMSEYLEQLRNREAQEDKDFEKIDQELMKKLETI